MTFVEGFLTAVPTDSKQAYLDHARKAVPLFQRLGATRFVETWGDDVPDGKVNDLKKAVAAKADETVLFSWIEYPDKAARDAANAKMMEDPDMKEMGELPFDATRMIYAGFDLIADAGSNDGTGYVDGCVLPVPSANKDAYRTSAEAMAAVFREYGALRVADGWGEDVPEGKVTDYHRATLRKDDETVVYSWIEWPSKQVRDAAWEKAMADPRMNPEGGMPFDGQRMMWGGFAPILDETN